MSIDWTVLCDKCQVYRHLGQYMGGRCSFGYGYRDDDGRLVAGEFIMDHIYCDSVYEGLRIVRDANIPTAYKNLERKNETNPSSK